MDLFRKKEKTVNLPLLKSLIKEPLDCRAAATLLSAFQYLFWILKQNTPESYRLAKHFALKRIIGNGVDGVTVFEDYTEDEGPFHRVDRDRVPFALKLNRRLYEQPDYENGKAINNLRLAGIPTFMLTYDQLNCPSPSFGTLLCKPFGRDVQMIALEYVPGSPIHSTPLNLEQFERVIANLMLSVALMQKILGKGHGDLHDQNVIIRPLDRPTRITLAGEYVVTGCEYLPVIIDYGRISVESSAAFEIGRFLGFVVENTQNEEIRERALQILKRLRVKKVIVPFREDNFHQYPHLKNVHPDALIDLVFDEFPFVLQIVPPMTVSCPPYKNAFVKVVVPRKTVVEEKAEVRDNCNGLNNLVDDLGEFSSAGTLILMSNYYDDIKASRYADLCSEETMEKARNAAKNIMNRAMHLTDELEKIRFERPKR
ncbi:hypothetical protein GpartN1_g1950.t1 [Galdieria partita]|uniref:Protein kinase domain-containing protein n=1 Tax=Galdieria partita TaxID=83374 RepID=A0A9C7PTZ2_9RHOD|nr:hypothetical protein GpartN1_g1950.t1 [Galdieria partita]